MLRVAGEWGTSSLTLDQLLRKDSNPADIRAARAWREGCYRAFIQVKHLHDFGALIDPNAPEYQQARPS